LKEDLRDSGRDLLVSAAGVPALAGGFASLVWGRRALQQRSERQRWRAFVRRHPAAVFYSAAAVGLLVARATQKK
jgi:hypothetical protein